MFLVLCAMVCYGGLLVLQRLNEACRQCGGGSCGALLGGIDGGRCMWWWVPLHHAVLLLSSFK